MQISNAVFRPMSRLEGYKLDLFDIPPRVASSDDLGLEEAEDRLGQGVVERVSDASD